MVHLSHPQTTTAIILTIWSFVDIVMSLLFHMLSRFVRTFLPRIKCLLISWLQSPHTEQSTHLKPGVLFVVRVVVMKCISFTGLARKVIRVFSVTSYRKYRVILPFSLVMVVVPSKELFCFIQVVELIGWHKIIHNIIPD